MTVPATDMTNPWSPSADRREPNVPTRTAGGLAGVLRALHRPGDPLILPNAWDAASARAVEAAGFPAVATSSAAIAAVLGFADGEAVPVEEALGHIARIAGAVAIPVTADLERGYEMTPAQLVERLVATGAAGCNLEDSDPRTGIMVDPHRQADFLAAVREAARHAGADLVLNARIDTYLRSTGTPAELLAMALRRTGLYLTAGADCVYPIAAAEPQIVQALARQAGGRINVMFTSNTPSLAELAGLGVARISFGAGLHRATQVRLVTLLNRIAVGDMSWADELPT